MKIKTLEWELLVERMWFAPSEFGKYQIVSGHLGTSMVHLTTPGWSAASGCYSSVEAAQTAAQVDFESRIMRCMED